MTHTDECQAALDKRAAEIATWATTWPDHCKSCHGWGGAYSSYDPSPAGVSLGSGSLVDFDSCPECADKGLCPRCGETLNTGLATLPLRTEPPTPRCPACGWREDETPGCPRPAECFCWFAEEPFDERGINEHLTRE